VADYRILPEALLPAAPWGFGLAELAAGLALLAPATRAAGALAVALLLGTYALAIAWNLLRGRRHIDCGCSGPGGRRTLGEGLVFRNVCLLAAAGVAGLPVAARPWVWLDAVTAGAGAVVLALLYVALDGALANAPRSAWLRGGGGLTP
jgi:hypothetical protein